MQPIRRSTRLSTVHATSTSVKAAKKRPQKQTKKHPVPKKNNNHRESSSSEDESITEDGPPPGETDPASINQPLSALIDENLKKAWAINKKQPMCFIFDSVSPAREFLRGMEYDEGADFPEPDDKDGSQITDTDDVPMLMPIMPGEPKYVAPPLGSHTALTRLPR